MSLCDAPGLLSFEQALEQVTQATTAITETELLPITEADGRVLAESAISSVSVPPCDNSAMDGYALRAEDWGEGSYLPVSQSVFAGDSGLEPLQPGTCARIMTGAPVPPGSDTVIMQEQANRVDDAVCFEASPKTGANIRLQGEEIQPGDTVLPAGRKLRAADLGLLASLGIGEVKVIRAPVVTLMTTGNELVKPGEALAPGKIYESNSVVLSAMLKRLGCIVHWSGIVPDQRDALRDAFRKADETSDLVISTGGVSVGEADFVRDILEETGDVTLWKLAIKPGKPFAFGTLPNSLFAGLPGNPVSAVVTFDQLVVPVIRILSGEQPGTTNPDLRFKARLSQTVRHRAGRLELQRGELMADEAGTLTFSPLAKQGSALLSTLSQANSYLRISAEKEGLDAGAEVDVDLFGPWLM